MLPIELSEKIIEECEGDRPCLAACSLVCRAWVPKSRLLLFKDKRINLQHSNADSFVSLLEDPKSMLAPLITAVEVNFPRYLHNIPSPIHELAPTLIEKCKGLTSLKVVGSGPQNLSLLTDLSSSLTHLELVDSLPGWGRHISHCAGSILDIVGNFRALEALTMSYDMPGMGVEDDPIDPIYDPNITKLPSSLARLRRLQMDVIWTSFLPWFLIPGVLRLPVLETMELMLLHRPYNPVGGSLAQSFLDLYSSSVKTLILHLTWQIFPTLDLSRFSVLRSITFRMEGTPSICRFSGELQKLADIVSTCPNRSPTDPLVAIVTNDKVNPVAIEGVRWISDSRYFREEYDGLGE